MNSDGQYVPLEKVSEVTICNDVKEHDYSPLSLLSQTTLEFNATLTSQSEKRLRKMFRRMKNHMMRKKRTAIRRKEKLRRLSLKADRILRGV